MHSIFAINPTRLYHCSQRSLTSHHSSAFLSCTFGQFEHSRAPSYVERAPSIFAALLQSLLLSRLRAWLYSGAAFWSDSRKRESHFRLLE